MEKYIHSLFKFYRNCYGTCIGWGLFSLLTGWCILQFSTSEKLSGFNFGHVTLGGLILLYGIIHSLSSKKLYSALKISFSGNPPSFYSSETNRVSASVVVLNRLLTPLTAILFGAFILALIAMTKYLTSFWMGVSGGIFLQSAIAIVIVSVIRFQENAYLDRLKYYSGQSDVQS